ncbi:MAG: prephenate dehydrogenase/arogenate dehydrogenase family protein, partial [Catenulispora sp.]|nr:prephenate dehydrogenase/arogenate dehydrogenase family protein [Catenulispora sp.]
MRSALVVGTGLIGTSIALALSRRGVDVYLHDADESAARTAASLGAGRATLPAQPVDIAILAVPPARIGDVLAKAQQQQWARVFTDVGSVKTRVHGAAEAAG